jgi:hypothetical protein
MSLSDISAIGSLVSGMAVLVSLVYLSLQIRQNTKHSQALIQQGRAARITDVALRLAELRGDDGLHRCFEGWPEASDKDVSRFLNVARAVFISAEDSFLQSEEGLLNPTAFNSYMASVRIGLGSLGVAAAWLLTRDMYEPKFRAFMDANYGGLAASARSRPREAWRTAIASLSKSGATAVAAEPSR